MVKEFHPHTWKCLTNSSDSHIWEVVRVFTVSAVSSNNILTECDVKCTRCALKMYVVTKGNIFQEGEVIQ